MEIVLENQENQELIRLNFKVLLEFTRQRQWMDWISEGGLCISSVR